MNANLAWALGAVVLDSLISLVGAVTLAFNPRTLQKVLGALASFGAGSLLGAALLDLLPEAFGAAQAKPTTVCLYVLVGLVAFVVIERALSWSHHSAPEAGIRSAIGPVLLVGMGLHNFLDGALIASAFSSGFRAGLVTTAAIFFHEIPKELGDFAVLVHSGFTPRRALLFNFLSALTSIAGAIVAFFLSSTLSGFTVVMLPFTAGGFIFIGCRLLFELEEHGSRRAGLLQLGTFALGIGVMAAITLTLHE